MVIVMVVHRLLEQGDAMMLYFNDKVLTEILATDNLIHSSLNDPLIKLFLLFLDWILPSSLNSFFQNSNAVITKLHDKMILTYKDIIIIIHEPKLYKHNPIQNY